MTEPLASAVVGAPLGSLTVVASGTGSLPRSMPAKRATGARPSTNDCAMPMASAIVPVTPFAIARPKSNTALATMRIRPPRLTVAVAIASSAASLKMMIVLTPATAP